MSSFKLAWVFVAGVVGSLAFLAVPAVGQATVAGLPQYGVQLELAASWVRSPDSGAVGLMVVEQGLANVPYLANAVVLWNKSDKPIIGYDIRWTGPLARGADPTGYSSYFDEYALGKPAGVASSSVIPPGGVRIITSNTNIGPEQLLDAAKNPPPHPNTWPRLGAADLDGVFFSDGSFLGPDVHHFLDRTRLHFSAGRDLAVFVLGADDAGMSDDDLRSALERQEADGHAVGRSSNVESDIYTSERGTWAWAFLQDFGARGRAKLHERAQSLVSAKPMNLWRAQ